MILLFVAVLGGSFFLQRPAYAYGECSEYGFMASYDYLSNSCKCMSGYVFGKDFLGKTTCVSGSSICYNKYGYNSQFDSLSNSCECSYGYVFGKDSLGQTSCISEDQVCTDQYGYNARSSYGGKCECSYGYVFGKDSIGRTRCVTEDQACKDQYGYDARSIYGGQCECGYGYVMSGGQCTHGNTLCRSKHGLYSSYDDSSNSCECDSGYTLDDYNQCAEKQNNVYFKLLDINTDERQAILKSDYDSRQYLVTYGIGCLSSTFERYRYKNLVVNLGTDFDLDTWDTIVLQDDNQTCSITYRERTFDDSFPSEVNDAEILYDYVPAATPPPAIVFPSPSFANQPVANPKSVQKQTSVDFEVLTADVNFHSEKRTLTSSAAFRKCPSIECSLIRYYAEGSELNVTGEYKKGEWYQINGTTDAGGMGEKITGWIHQSLFEPISSNSDLPVDTSTSTSREKGVPNFLSKVWGGFLSWFRR